MRSGTILVALALLALASRADGAERTHFPAPGEERSQLVVFSVTDLIVIHPLLANFQSLNPGVAIDYVEFLTNEVYETVVGAGAWQGLRPDLIISSAMDLQAKLVNDGFAQSYRSSETDELPAWANWRNQAFGFTFEPAVMVYDPKRLPAADVPLTRFDLVRLLREKSEVYDGRIGTYDIAESGIGYLFATQDAMQAHTFGRIIEGFGRNAVRLACCTSDLLDAIEEGRILIGYNLLGSYTKLRIENGASLAMVLPKDYTLVMSRVAFIHRDAPHTRVARAFLDHLLSRKGQEVLARQAHLYAIHPDLDGPSTAAELRQKADGPLRPITVGPGLLVYLDKLKRNRFLDEWRGSVGDNRVGP
jgi:ABC-type Fe3+ transport system substrate-binding protein